ncbi:MAG: DNA topoisomerase IB [Chloroflexi bacterium]|nr:DNA topoisomerase IB [Chloroflexota bacterium]
MRDVGEGAESAAEVAASAGLHYVDDARPGITRRRFGKGFAYYLPDGSKVTDADTRTRLAALAVPPAWTDVWLSPDPLGHIQATGRDARGRKQYRYHPQWRAIRDQTKYNRMEAFGEALPRIRQRVDHDMGLRGMPREKVLAIVVRLLDETSIRIGNDEYARENRSFGLTTLRRRHVHFEGSSVRFEFEGKSKKKQVVEVNDRRLARLVRRCEELPGYELFQYVDEEGQRRRVESGDVNEYLREVSGADFTAKDFRTWNGTVAALGALRLCEPASSERESKHQVAEAIRQVARRLGNTPAVARNAYVHPGVVQAYLEGRLPAVDEALAEAAATAAPEGLSEVEQCVVNLLHALSEEAAPAAA